MTSSIPAADGDTIAHRQNLPMHMVLALDLRTFMGAHPMWGSKNRLVYMHNKGCA